MHDTLVTTQDLAAHREWRVFDCRHDLTDPAKGRRSYERGHIPGAVHAHLDNDLSGVKTGSNGRHPLPAPESFAMWLGANGVSRGDQIVVYDDVGGAYAARLWWMCKWLAHEQVAVLDGGLEAWLAAGGELETDVPSFAQTRYDAMCNDGRRVDVGELEANIKAPAFQVIDARNASRYAGEGETVDAVGGHIPGALNRPYSQNLDGNGRFKRAALLRQELTGLLGSAAPENVVHQCGSGVTACHNLLAMEIAGFKGSRLYPGSWSEWSSNPQRPVATGA